MNRSDWFIRANLKLRHLQLLIALDELHSIGRVADLMSLTQPAISKMLSSLESGIGVRLFERGASGLRPTAHGISLIYHAREILRQIGAAQEDLRSLSEGNIRRVALGVMPAAAIVLVPRFIAALEAQTSDIAISVREGTVDTLIPALRDGALDIMAGVLPHHINAEVRVETLYSDRFVVTVRKAHPLASQPNVDWGDLRSYPMIMPPTNALTYEMLTDMLARHKISKSRRSVNSVSTLTNMGVLRHSNSVALMPFEVARDFEASGALTILPLSVPDVRRNVGLMWLARRHDRAIETVIELFRGTRDAMRQENLIDDSDSEA